MLEIVAHSSRAYPPRTYENAWAASLTVALALDFSTAGERLTKKAAGERYLALPIGQGALTSARQLYARLRDDGKSAPVLNIAGNGIYSLAGAGWTQAAVNLHLYEILSRVHSHWPLGQVISGGQTGVDLAGGIAGHALGVPVRMTLPAGFLQRGLDHRDASRSEDEIRAEVLAGAKALLDPASTFPETVSIPVSS